MKKLIFFILFLVISNSACSSNSPDLDDGDSASDSQATGDTNSYPDTVTDTDTDTESDTNSDTETSSDNTSDCQDGIPNGGNTVCCPLSCGACGGTGCSGFPGGFDSCCAGPIIDSMKYCDDNPPPCIIGSATVDTDTGSDEPLTLLETAVELGRSIITEHSYSATGVADKEYQYAGAMGGRGITYRGYQYIVYYEGNGAVTIARRKVDIYPVKWELSTLSGYTVTTDDRHNKMSIAISKGDGKIHIAFDHHTSNEFHYADTIAGVADNPENVVWDNKTFTYKENLNHDEWFSGAFPERTVTYPSFIEVGDDIMLYWRSGGTAQGRMNIGNYSTTTHEWVTKRTFSSEKGTYTEGAWSSTTRGPYNAGLILDPAGTLHVAWVWRESGCTQTDIRYCNHGLYYAYTPDMGANWYTSDDTKVAGPTELISVENITPVWDIGIELDPTNTNLESRFVEETGAFEVYVTHKDVIGGTARSTYRYALSSDGKWTKQKVDMTPGGLGVELPAGSPEGVPNETWDYTRLKTDGIVSLVYQDEPDERGQSTPLYVIDYKFAE